MKISKKRKKKPLNNLQKHLESNKQVIEIIKERNKNSKIKVKTIKIMKRKQKTIMNSRRITVKIINNTFQRIISDNSKVSKINGKKNMKIKNRRTRNSIIRKGRINMDRNKENNM